MAKVKKQPKAKKKQQKRKYPRKRKVRITPNTLRERGLPTPAALDLKGTNITQLTKEWYAKLAADGFDDIEWTGGDVESQGVDSPYLKRADNSAIRHVKMNSFEHYRLCAAYLTHNPWWERSGDKLIWSLYTEGMPYRDITVKYNASKARSGRKARPKRSLFYIFTRIQELVEAMKIWQKTSPHGLRLAGNDDFMAEEVLLKEPEPIPTV